jgi:hypothetical protein
LNSNPFVQVLQDFQAQLEGLRGDALHAYEDLEFFSRYVMSHDDPSYESNSRFIQRIYEELQHGTDRHLMILGPRNSAKSTAVTVTYTAWMIGRNPLIRILLAFASADQQGKAFNRQLDHIMAENPRYLEIFGALKPDDPDKWTAQEKIVKRNEPPGGMKDPTLSVVGLGTNIPSRRADIIICDDLVTQANAFSQIERDKVQTFVLLSLFPISAPGGKRIILGSRWDPDDLYGRMAKQWDLTFPEDTDVNIAEILQNVLVVS